MRPELPWNVAGIPPEAREAARAAARREGLSVGEWLTRRIIRSFADPDDDAGDNGGATDAWPSNGSASQQPQSAPSPAPRTSRQASVDMLARVSRSESDSQDAFRRIEDQLRTLSRRLDATERSQTENGRAMSKAATEINISAREQTQAFDQLGTHVVGLGDRIDRVERQAKASDNREAVKALQQGLSRLADQISQTAHESTAQIASLAGSVESLASKFLQARTEQDQAAQALEERFQFLDERMQTAEQSAAKGIEPEMQRQASALTQLNDALDRLNTRLANNEVQTAGAAARVEESISRIETRPADAGLDRRLGGIERVLSDISGRLDANENRFSNSSEQVSDGIKALTMRLENSDKKNSASIAELRTAFNDSIGRVYNPASNGNGHASAMPNLDLPPFPAAPPPAAPASAYQAPSPDPFAPPPHAPTFDTPPPAFEPSANFAAEPPPPAYQPDPFAAPPPISPFGSEEPAANESYLNAARRAARTAAMTADAERARGPIGAFQWGNAKTVDATEKPKTRYGMIAGLVFIAILAAVAGVWLSQRMASHGANTTPANGLNALVTKPATAPATATTQIKPATPPGSPVLPNAAHATPPAQTGPRPLPNTPATQTPKPNATTATPPKPVQSVPTQAAAIPPLQRLAMLANTGNANAQTALGLKYLDGDGVQQNDSEAAKWLALAAAQGQAIAEYRLGTLYERGRGVKSDTAKAAHWYQLAATHGNRKAMHNLAVAFAEGAGVQKNYSEAARWFSKAANLGLADSQFNLAVLYERGLGVPQSLVDAYKWYAIAASQGDTESKSRIDALATQLSADERAAAQKAAAGFRPQPLNRGANVPPDVGARQG